MASESLEYLPDSEEDTIKERLVEESKQARAEFFASMKNSTREKYVENRLRDYLINELTTSGSVASGRKLDRSYVEGVKERMKNWPKDMGFASFESQEQVDDIFNDVWNDLDNQIGTA